MKRAIIIGYVIYQLLSFLQFSFSINMLHGTEGEREQWGELFPTPTTSQYGVYYLNMLLYVFVSFGLLGLYRYQLKSNIGKGVFIIGLCFSHLFLIGWLMAR